MKSIINLKTAEIQLYQMFESWGWKISVEQKSLLQYFVHKKMNAMCMFIWLKKVMLHIYEEYDTGNKKGKP